MHKLKVVLPLIFFAIGCQTKKDDTLFRLVPSEKTGIDFTNELTETYAENMLFFSNFYTGGGVGILDVNNDGLPDLLFGANQTTCKLYLNQGNLKFDDITKESGIETNRWVTGISVVDINNDGFDDFYLSVSGFTSKRNTGNLFFINNGDNTFTERAAEYGLDVIDQTTHTSFFDYDSDGDLDAFMAINPTDFSLYYMNKVKPPQLNGKARSTDKLFENLGNGKFKDVSKTAGIRYEGYSLGLNTSDFNDDGLVDIYVTNDFITNDILYINQGDGTFINEIKTKFEVTSYASMGNDVADINNDGLVDLFTLDMLPEDSYREKMLVNTTSYNFYQMQLKMGYHPQFSRNILQVNNGNGTFSEIGQLAGISRTDWSWSPLLADFDNDGYKDLHVTNGFRRELGNLDYLNYDEYSPFVNPTADIQKQIDGINNTPGEPLPNYAYKNNGDFTFTKKSEEWGIDMPSYSSGSATVDLDLDGDLDLVINNIDMEAMVYENLAAQKNKYHYLQVRLQYPGKNQHALGSKIVLTTPKEKQIVEINPYRGYLSSSEKLAHFGLGELRKIDSLKIQWPDGKWSFVTDIDVDTTITLNYAAMPAITSKENKDSLFEPKFHDITLASGLDFDHRENTQVDFHKQFLLPHQHSRLGPGIAVGDSNGDGLEDFYIGGAAGQSGRLFKQRSDATFEASTIEFGSDFEDMGAIFFDYDQDGDNDLYVVSGGTSAFAKPERFQDRLYDNDGHGNYKLNQSALPIMHTSTASVTASDYDKDGDLDLFVGGRIVPRQYPAQPRSYILENSDGRFIDVTEKIAPGLSEVGMVSQGIWSDYDDDDDLDLFLVGEWMPITVYENDKGKFIDRTNTLGLEKTSGWWNSITSADLNGDGRTDYVLGNLGLNNMYQTDEENPLILKSKDFDGNGGVDLIFFKNYVDGHRPIASRNDFLGQLPHMRVKYPNYESYAQTSGDSVFKKEDWEGVSTNTAYQFENVVLMNMGKDSLVQKTLPNNAQFAPIFGSVPLDINSDGAEEIVFSGNLFSSNIIQGPYSSSTGGVITTNHKDFEVTRGNVNGLNLRGDRKAMATILLANDELAVLSIENDGVISLHSTHEKVEAFYFDPKEFKAEITMKNGERLIKTSQYGAGYLSQSSRILPLPKDWDAVTFTSFDGSKRIIHYGNQ